MKIIGIDLGKTSIKVAEIEVGTKQNNLVGFENYPLSIDPNKDLEIELIDTLRQIVKKYDQSETRFVLGLNQARASVRRRLFPFKERHKILKSLPFELEDDIPFDHTDAVFDAKVTRFVGDSADLIGVACPKEHVARALQLASDCQFQIDILSPKGLALANLFEPWSEAPPTVDEPKQSDDEEENAKADLIAQPAEVYLHIGFESTLLTVYKQSRLLEVRHFDWGGQNLALAIAKKYSIHLAEAMNELEAKSFLLMTDEGATREQIEFSDVLKDSLKEFALSLNLTLLEIKSLYHLNITKASFGGGVSKIKNLAPCMTQLTELPFRRANQLQQVDNLEVNLSDAEESFAGVAVGLALEGLKRANNPATNLLRDEFAKQSKTFTHFIERWGFTLKIAAAAFVVAMVFGIYRENLATQMADLAYSELKKQASNIAGLKGRKANARGVKKYVRDQERAKKSRELTASLNAMSSAFDILKNLTAATPGKRNFQIKVRRFSLNNGSLSVEGEVPAKTQMNQVTNIFKRVAEDGKVKNLTTRMKPQSGWKMFSYGLNVKRLED